MFRTYILPFPCGLTALVFQRDMIVVAETWVEVIFLATGILLLGGFLILIGVELAIEIVRAGWQSGRIVARSRRNTEAEGRSHSYSFPGSLLRVFRGEFFSSYDWIELRSGGRFYHVPWKEKAALAREEAEWGIDEE